MIISREKLMGMTTNERLFEVELLDAFNQAVRDRDPNKVRSILRSVFVDEESIETIIQRI